MAFSGFLRSLEFTVPSQSQFDPNEHLCLSDISLDSSHFPQIVQVNIKQSKTDPFRRGITLSPGRKGHKICPLKAIVPFLAARGSGPAHYSCSTTNKLTLTREMLR